MRDIPERIGAPAFDDIPDGDRHIEPREDRLNVFRPDMRRMSECEFHGPRDGTEPPCFLRTLLSGGGHPRKFPQTAIDPLRLGGNRKIIISVRIPNIT